jgi:hypothetical protein
LLAKDKEKKNHIQSKQRKKSPKPLKLESKKPKEKKEAMPTMKVGQIFFLFNPLVTKLHFLKPTIPVTDTNKRLYAPKLFKL